MPFTPSRCLPRVVPLVRHAATFCCTSWEGWVGTTCPFRLICGHMTSGASPPKQSRKEKKKEQRTIEFTPSVGRTRFRGAHCSAVLPHSRIFLTKSCRLLHPLEALAMQGIIAEREASERFDHSVLYDLAGNAFSSTCFMATIFATALFSSDGFEARLIGSVPRVRLGPCQEDDADL